MRRVLITAVAVAALLAGCTSAETPEQTPDAATIAFDGQFAVDWAHASPPAFAEAGGVYDFTAAAGRLWALASDETTVTLLSSADGLRWERVDRPEFEGVPVEEGLYPHFIADAERVTIVIKHLEERYQEAGQFSILIGTAAGDDIAWQLAPESAFAPWQVEHAGYRFSPGSPGNGIWLGDTLLMLGHVGFYPEGSPSGTGNASWGVFRYADGAGQRHADPRPPLGAVDWFGSPHYTQLRDGVAFAELGGTVHVLGGSIDWPSQLNVWSTPDAGASWSLDLTPVPLNIKDRTALIVIRDAITTEHGIIAAGTNGGSDDGAGLLLHSADGKTWAVQMLEEVQEINHLLEVNGTYYAIASQLRYDPLAPSRVWASADGQNWQPLPSMTLPQQLLGAVVVGAGIVVATETELIFSGILPPLVMG